MATREQAQESLLDAIVMYSKGTSAGPNSGRTVRNLAEAWAWLQSPDQPHGGSVEMKTG